MCVIDNEVCSQCDECKDACPCDAIIDTPDGKRKIDPDLCAECGACFDVCEFGAISETDEIPSERV